jgi:hypothetical protein
MKFLKIAVIIIFFTSCRNNETNNEIISYDYKIKTLL